MSDNNSDVDLCLEYLDNHVEDDEEIEIVLYQDGNEDSIDGGNNYDDDAATDLLNDDDIDDYELKDDNLFTDFEDISSSEFTPTPSIPESTCGKTPNAKNHIHKIEKLTTDDEQTIATEICELPLTDDPDYPYKMNDSDDSDYDITEAKNNNMRPLGPYQCMKCLYNTDKKLSLMRHLRTHRLQMYKCSVCQKSFRRKDHLSRHLIPHMGITSFECSDCDKTFPSYSRLASHKMISHSDMEPFQCKICGYSVFQLHKLKIHMRTHTNERPYKCDQCNHASHTASALQIHMISHTNEKPFVCQICDSRYKRMYNLKMHMGKHHKYSELTFNLMIK